MDADNPATGSLFHADSHFMHRTGPRPSDRELWNDWEQKAAVAQNEIVSPFNKLENTLGRNGCFCGSLSTADIAIFMMVFYSQRLGGPSLGHTPYLKTWYKELAQRSAFRTTINEIRQADLELSHPVIGAYPDFY